MFHVFIETTDQSLRDSFAATSAVSQMDITNFDMDLDFDDVIVCEILKENNWVKIIETR